MAYNIIKFGTVVDINDPEKLGRVKVNVYGLHDNIDTADLPWSMVMMPGNTPAKSGIGSSVNLLVGTLVVGMCMDKSMQEFMVMGTLPTKTDGTEDNNVRVRAEADPNADEELGSYQPSSGYAPVYPYNNVMETESGHVKEYDDTPSAERIMERHKSGTQYEIGPNGSKVERIIKDNYQLVAGNDTIEVKGSVKIIVSGDAKLSVAKDLTANVGGMLETVVAGNAIATIAGTTTVLNTGDMNLTVSGEDSANLTIKSQYSTTEAAGSTTMHKGEIKLDGNVTVTGTTKIVDGTITLDTHTHGSNNVNQVNTAGPNTD